MEDQKEKCTEYGELEIHFLPGLRLICADGRQSSHITAAPFVLIISSNMSIIIIC